MKSSGWVEWNGVGWGWRVGWGEVEWSNVGVGWGGVGVG